MRLFLSIILLVVSLHALAQRELTTITVNYAAAEQLLAVIRPYLSEGSTVSVYQNRLILNVTPEELAKTRELLQRLDTAGKQLLVSVRTEGAGSDEQRGIAVEGAYKSGDTVITSTSRGRSTETHTTVRTQNYRGTSSDNGNQSVRVTEGMPAYIAAGVSAPVQTYVVAPDGQRYYQQDYVSAVAGFYATTWLNDGTVRISIDQSNDQLQGRTVATQQLRSEVTGALGQWLPLGAISTSTSQQDSDIGSRGQSGRAGSTELFIKVEVLE